MLKENCLRDTWTGDVKFPTSYFDYWERWWWERPSDSPVIDYWPFLTVTATSVSCGPVVYNEKDNSATIKETIVGMKKDNIKLEVLEDNVIHLLYEPGKCDEIYTCNRVERVWQIDTKKEIDSVSAKYEAGILLVRVLLKKVEKKVISVKVE